MARFVDLTGGEDLLLRLVTLSFAGFELTQHEIGPAVTHFVLSGPGYSGNGTDLQGLIERATRFIERRSA